MVVSSQLAPILEYILYVWNLVLDFYFFRSQFFRFKVDSDVSATVFFSQRLNLNLTSSSFCTCGAVSVFSMANFTLLSNLSIRLVFRMRRA